MTEWPNEYGIIDTETGDFHVTIETLELVRAQIAARVEWIDFEAIHGGQVRIRTVRISSTGSTTRENRRTKRLRDRHLEQEQKEDMPDWEEAS